LTYDFKIGCKPFSSLVELIEVHANLKELEEFEKKFENEKKIMIKKMGNIFIIFYTSLFLFFNFFKTEIFL
jgi:hypothetical protein